MAKPGGDNPNGGVNDQSEKTQAAYAMLRFGSRESGNGAWDGNIGVRVVKTEVEATGFLRITSPQNVMHPVECVEATVSRPVHR